MATMSIEILCVGAKAVALPTFDNLGVDTSSPPKSDRSPALWQVRMNELGGILIHIFDPDRRGEQIRWAYDIVEESNWETFKFSPPIWENVRLLMAQLIEESPDGRIEFYTDAQWSNKPVVNNDLRIDAFIKIHDQSQLRMNTAYPIKNDHGDSALIASIY